MVWPSSPVLHARTGRLRVVRSVCSASTRAAQAGCTCSIGFRPFGLPCSNGSALLRAAGAEKGRSSPIDTGCCATVVGAISLNACFGARTGAPATRPRNPVGSIDPIRPQWPCTNAASVPRCVRPHVITSTSGHAVCGATGSAEERCEKRGRMDVKPKPSTQSSACSDVLGSTCQLDGKSGARPNNGEG